MHGVKQQKVQELRLGGCPGTDVRPAIQAGPQPPFALVMWKAGVQRGGQTMWQSHTRAWRHAVAQRRRTE
eukprot:5674311-Amphidinium_carterae.1